jgi:hypothetical protein
MRRAVRRVILVGATVAMGAAGTLTAYANWSTPGTATVRGRVAAMPQGVEPSVAKDGKAAVVSWSSQEIAEGADMTAYVITAHSVDTSPAKPNVVHTVTATNSGTHSVTFTAGELAGGSWKWTLTPKFHTWTGAESPPTKKLTFPAAEPATSLVAQTTDPTPPTSASTSSAARSQPGAAPKPAAPPEETTPAPAEEPKSEEPKSEEPTKAPDPTEPSPAESSSSIAAPDDEVVDK